MKKKALPLSKKVVKTKLASKSPAPSRSVPGRIASSSGYDGAYHRIQGILSEARSQAWRAVNTAMVNAYW
jgi:hypothetical protein